MSPETKMYQNTIPGHYIAQQCHNSKRVIFQADFKGFEVLKSSECNDDTNALQRRILQTALLHYTCVKVQLQTSLSMPVTQKCQILSCDTIVANERYKNSYIFRQ